MALAFAPLALKVPLEIEEAEVVSKSFPEFWEDLQQLGFSVENPASDRKFFKRTGRMAASINRFLK